MTTRRKPARASKAKAGKAQTRRSTEASLDDLQKCLVIDKHALDDALEKQPVLFDRVARELAYRISLRDKAKEELELVEAEVMDSIRTSYVNADEKVTEGQIKSEVRMDKQVEDATSNYLSLRTDVNNWAALKEAFEQRSYAIKDLVSLYGAGYWSDIEQNKSREAIKDRQGHEARQAMTKARKRRQ